MELVEAPHDLSFSTVSVMATAENLAAIRPGPETAFDFAEDSINKVLESF